MAQKSVLNTFKNFHYFYISFTQTINPLFHICVAYTLSRGNSSELYSDFIVQYSILICAACLIQKTKWQHMHFALNTRNKSSYFFTNILLLNEALWAVKTSIACFICLVLLIPFIDQTSAIDLFGVALIILTSNLIFNGIVVGYIRFYKKYLFYMIFLILNSIVKLLGLYLSVDVYFISIIYYFCLVDILMWLPLLIFVIFQLSQIKNQAMDDSKNAYEKLSEMSEHKKGQYLTSVVNLPIQHLDKVLLSFILVAPEIALYAVIQKITQLFSFLIEPLNVLMMRENIRTGTKPYKFYELLKRFAFAFCIQLPFLYLIILQSTAFFNTVLNTSTELTKFIFFYIIFSIASGFYFIHVLSVKYLLGNIYFLSTILALLSYLITVVPLSMFFGIYGALSALCVQYFFIIVIRSYYLKKSNIF